MDSPVEVSVYRRTLCAISDELTDKEVERLGFLCKDHLTVKEREDIKYAFQLFEILEQKGIISENNFMFLVERMEDMGRIDLKKKLTDIMPESGAGHAGNPPKGPQPGSGAGSPPSSGSSAAKGSRSYSYDIRNSPLTLGDSIGNVYNYGSSTGGPTLTPTPDLPSRSTQGAACATSTNVTTIKAVNSPITLGNSLKNTFNYGSKTSPPGVPKPQSQGRAPEASGAQVGTPTSSTPLARENRPSPPNPSTLKTPADFYSHSPKARPTDAGRQGDSNSALKTPVGKSASSDKTQRVRVNEPSILDLPNVLTPQPSGHVSDDESSSAKASSNLDANQVSKDDVETDAPQASKVKIVDALLIDFQSDYPASALPQQGTASCKIASVEDLKDVFSQGVGIQGASGDEMERIGMGEDTGGSEMDSQIVLRDYQHELAHDPLATGGNYIICAPTGSGKTLTAASICYEKYIKYQANPTPGRYFKALFIVNIRHLMQQQRNAFQEYFPDRLAIRTIGEQQPFEYALMKDESLPVVLTLTAQIFVNALRQKVVTLQDFDMLIFDECHHTDLSHPYNVIMQWYLKDKAALSQGVGEQSRCLPQVIGLSASLGVGRGKMALGHLLKLCANMDVRDIKRVHKHKKQLDEFVKAPEQDVIISVPPRVTSRRHFGSLLEEIMSKIEDQLGATEGSSLPCRGCQPYENKVVDCIEKAEHGENILYMYLNAYNKALMLFEDLPVQDCFQTLEKFYDSRSVGQNGEYTQQEKFCQDLFDRNVEEMQKLAKEESDDSNPKLQKLIELLAKQFTQNPHSKGIVLTRMKVATKALCQFIRSSQLLQELPLPVRPERLVGQGAFEDYCMTESEQKMILESFRKEDGCNVLVATDIAQEGLDMPACNSVIRYNFVSNEIGTVQSKGRARAEGSKCFLIVESGSFNEQREFENRAKLKSMGEALKELEAMPEEERLRGIKAKQDEILNAMAETERQHQIRVAQAKKKEILLKCAECREPICKSSDLRRKGAGGYVTCVNPDIEKRITDVMLEKSATRYRDTQSVCKIMCGNPKCKNQLGTRETFFLSSEESPGFSLRAKSFLVQHERSGGEKKLKKWKDLAIIEDEEL